MGGTVLTRRVPTCYIANSSVFGAVQIANPSGGTAMIQTGGIITNPFFGNNYTVPFSLQFTLDQLAQYTDITGFCDRYKITNVTVKFQYNTDSVQGFPTATQGTPNIVPSLCWIVDSDDFALQTPTELNAKMGLKRKALNNGAFHSIKLRPKVAPAIFQSGIATAYSVPSKSVYLNSAYPSVPHYGVKGYIDNFYLGGSGGAASCITVDVTMTVALRDFQ